jgi:hypothetical protein
MQQSMLLPTCKHMHAELSPALKQLEQLTTLVQQQGQLLQQEVLPQLQQQGQLLQQEVLPQLQQQGQLLQQEALPQLQQQGQLLQQQGQRLLSEYCKTRSSGLDSGRWVSLPPFVAPLP